MWYLLLVVFINCFWLIRHGAALLRNHLQRVLPALPIVNSSLLSNCFYNLKHLDRGLIPCACQQRILTFTPWNVNIWCIVSEACEHYEYDDISRTCKQIKKLMALNDATHHASLDWVLILYACQQRILTFTPGMCCFVLFLFIRGLWKWGFRPIHTLPP